VGPRAGRLPPPPAHRGPPARSALLARRAAARRPGAGLASRGGAGAAAGLVLIVLLALPGQISDRRVNSHSRNLRQLSHLVAVHSRPGDALLFPHLNDHGFEAAYPGGDPSLRDVGPGPTPGRPATLLRPHAPPPVL